MMDPWNEADYLGPDDGSDLWPVRPAFLDLDEASLHRPEWSSHTSATLNNGEAWHFPLVGPVEILLSPGLSDLVASIPLITSFDPGEARYWADLSTLEAALRPIAARLLVLNYAIGLDGALDLVCYPQLWQAEFTLAVTKVLNDSWGAFRTVRHDQDSGPLFPN